MPLPTEFTVLDFETANEMRASACQIGLVRMNDHGETLERYSSLIKPDPGYEHFQPINISVHGIRETDVAHAPTMRELASDIQEFVGTNPIVAHNMAFDYSVWRAHTELGNLPDFINPRLCTLRMARYLLQRPAGTNGLESLIHDYCPGLAFAHHDASEDARVTGELFLAMLRHLEMPLEQLVKTFALTQAPRQRGGQGSGSGNGSGTRPARPEADLAQWTNETALEDEVVCFTGTLGRMKRADVQQLVEKLGGKVDKSVTKKTTQLVVGVPSPTTWRPGMDGSSKMVKARALVEKGAALTVMTENEFFAAIEE